MRMARLWLALLIVPLCAVGCSLPSPCLGPPGPAALQQERAMRFDPYPEPDTGPEVVGGRPRGFDAPAAEPTRARHWGSPTWLFGP